ncbi:hypothetical protein GPECTOR_19g248 [Gonium pectorale]|uniref:Ig-like domain-containing protein n=1 Tax=Gonium pectorale TaxID=33097 RepID=A0A150GJ08_GONPE|nr:hypothetical protein GPECTOR_19g248 [Gonium pectorale]|eukprot:KXZ49797.1 hypothetical protein GPECTOR_19g248 [Gonium pectorale]
MAATGQPPEVAPTTPPHLLPEKFRTSRVFGWQEKVYSRSEVAAAQAAAAAEAGLQPPLPGMPPIVPLPIPGLPGADAAQPGMAAAPGAAPLPTGPLPPGSQAQPPKSRRIQAFGSQSHLNTKHMGVTHVSRSTSYPACPATDTPAREVAHFAHPLELEWISRAPGPPPSNKMPVCTMDLLNRYSSEGYGWLSLEGRVPGCGTHVVRTWKPMGTIRDRQAEFFVGGSSELADLAYLTTPSGFNGRILNKYGFKTETIGAVKIRLNTVTQRFIPEAEAEALAAGGSPVRRGSPLKAAAAAAAAKRNKKDLSLKMVVERARQRLREARGVEDVVGGDVAVRAGLVAEAPTIVINPQDAVVEEEGTVRFKVVARGLPPLKYEWYKDDRRLVAATANQQELILVQVSLESEGAYYCQVSNKDGSVNSAKAQLTVTRAARVSRATAAADGQGGRSPVRRPPRAGGGGPVSPGSSAGGSSVAGASRIGGSGGGGGGEGRSGSRLSRLARLDAASTARASGIVGSDGGLTSPTGGRGPGSQASGGSGGGAVGPSPRTSGAGVPEQQPQQPQQPQAGPPAGGGAGGEAAGAVPLPPLPPSAMPPAPPGPPQGGDPGGGGGGGLPPAVAAAAASGFRKRPSRPASAASSAGGGSGGGAGAGGRGGGGGGSAGASADLEEIQEIQEMQAEAAQQAPAAVRRPAGSAQPPQPQRLPPRRQQEDEDDLEAEDID